MLSPVRYYANITNTFIDTDTLVSVSDKQEHIGMCIVFLLSRKSTIIQCSYVLVSST